MSDTLNLPPNPVVVYEYKDHISHSMHGTDHLAKAMEAINKHLVGTNAINIDWLVNASYCVPVIVRVYSDGHREMVPCEDFDDE
jgi:hypothetical protein